MTDSAVEHALFRLTISADMLQKRQWHPGYDVSVYRALRELHRALSVSECADLYDPHRLLRSTLFNGLAAEGR